MLQTLKWNAFAAPSPTTIDVINPGNQSGK
jgi:hypothetical protein